MDVKSIVEKMTLEEKARIVSGKNFWESKEFEKYGIKSHMFTDGPHGLRKQSGGSDHLGINLSDPSVCFPTASCSACSFDQDLLYKMGEALGDKCIRENVSVILGPGVNMKRSPVCGRNFEYFSEDPLLAGEMAQGLINGIQSKGVGASLKHFACNNQEYARMINDSNIDERTLREIYLTAFEIAVKKAKPYTVMCSYNKINGTYSSNNKWLLTDVLRKEWGFDGLVITDWGALEDPVEGIRAGCDLEMPFSSEDNALAIIDAVKNNELAIEDLNKSVSRMLKLCLKLQEDKKSISNDEEDHELAIKVASESAVLLKNDNKILPITKEEKVLLVGDMAIHPRFQGSGSSKIVTTKLDNIFDELKNLNVNVDFIQGYKGLKINKSLINEATNAAKKYDKVVIVCGLPDEYEGEGYDRKYFKIPSNHLKLIEEISKVNNNIILVLQGGSPFELSFKDKVQAILLTYLSGQGGGTATAKLLLGEANPSGKLAETWPIKLEDNPSYHYYPGMVKKVEYREGLYIGYRYYDTVNKEINYPFGYGLSYTSFAYSNLRVNKLDNYNYGINVDVTNTGEVEGKEIVELYLAKKESKIFRPNHELKGFTKVSLKPNETKTVTIRLNKDSFRYYNSEAKSFAYEQGEYEIEIAKSSRDIVFKESITIEGDGLEELLLDKYSKLTEYYKPSIPFKVDDKQFTILLGHEPASGELDKKGEFTINSCLEDLKSTWIGKLLARLISKSPDSVMEDNADQGMRNNASEMLLTMPLRAITMSGKITRKQVKGFVDIANGHLIQGIKRIIKK